MARARRSRQHRVHGEVRRDGGGIREAIYDLVRSIPRGRVMTYGQIAEHFGQLVSPRAVGWAMHTCPADVPWHRVVNARGGCSTERLFDLPPHLQQAMLEAEGVEFRPDRTLDLGRHRWTPAGNAAGKPAVD